MKLSLSGEGEFRSDAERDVDDVAGALRASRVFRTRCCNKPISALEDWGDRTSGEDKTCYLCDGPYLGRARKVSA